MRLDGLAQAELVRHREVTSRELVEAAIRRVERIDPALNAVVTHAFERALARAGSALGDGPFAGVPYLLKDLIDWEGVRTTNGSRLMLDFVSTETPEYVKRSEAAGLVVIGKTNTPEFGLLASTESLALGACHNPWNLAHSTGGSSGGAAAAVAAGLVPIAHASDGGGSIRVPASCCGVFGLKPSRGRMSFAGPPMPGDIAVEHAVSRSVRDSAMLLSRTEGDTLARVGYVAEPSRRKLRIAASVGSLYGGEPDADVRAATESAAQLCRELGHEVIDAAPTLDGAAFIDHFLTIWSTGPLELAEMVEKKTGKPAAEANLLEPWTLALAADLRGKPRDVVPKALAFFAEVEQRIAAFFEGIDVWLTPVLSSAPPKLGEQAPDVPYALLRERVVNYVAYTPVHNVSGTPAMSLPLAWTVAGLPLGAQFAARKGDERTLLELAYQLEAARPWKDRWPALSAA